MKEMKGRFLKKVNFIPTTITTLKQGLLLHHFNPLQNSHIESLYSDCKSNKNEEMELELEFHVPHHGNPIPPSVESKLSEEDQSDMEDDDSIFKDCEQSPEHASYYNFFEEKCPPRGENSVIFYTTSLTGIRKTYQDCRTIRFLLNTFKIAVQERDVSMDIGFREELWSILGERVIPPRLFIKGRYIGGANEVVTLHEQGKLKVLLEGMPVLARGSRGCCACAGMLFLVCSSCGGGRKVYKVVECEELCVRCTECNENGLVKCPICC